MLELIGGVFKGEEGVVDRHDSCIRIIKSGSHDEAADAAETIDAKSYGHDCSMLKKIVDVISESLSLCAI